MSEIPWTVRNKKIIRKDLNNWEKQYLKVWIDEKEQELETLEIKYLHDKNKLEDELAILKLKEKEAKKL